MSLTSFLTVAETQAHSAVQAALRWVARHPRRVTALIGSVLLGTGATAFAVATLVPDPSTVPVRQVIEQIEPIGLTASQSGSPEVLAPFVLYRSDVTRSNDTADSLLRRMGVLDAAAAQFIRSDANARQSLLGRTGRGVTVEVDANNALVKLTARWTPDDSPNFQRLVVEQLKGQLSSRIETAPLQASTRLGSRTIKSSLFAATDEARIPDSLAIQLAEIFSGDIDFHRALRKGDRFSVVYETLEGDGEPLRAGRGLSAEFVNGGKAHQAMWFQEPGAAAGEASATHTLTKGGYYTLAGESLRRAFLASPLEFSRVTSGFKMRFHPILQTWRAHLGVDYAAATGTPVRSVGDGIVDFAGLQGGFGNVVIVKHRNNQTTVYAHLSRINVKKGQSVSQGQNIGAVGATGWATGPHLHFEFRVNGVHQDPLTIARQSESVPVAANLKPVFDKSAALVRAQLAAAAQMQLGSAD